MSAVAIIIGVALFGQIGREYQYSIPGGSFPIGTTPQSAAADNAAAQPDASPPPGVTVSPTSPGPPGSVDSAYRTNGMASSPGGASATSNSTGSQAPSSGNNFMRGGAISPIQGGLSNEPIGREVQPAAGDSTLKPAGMIRAMMDPPANSRLHGDGITLEDIVVGASRGTQTARIEAYWDLCSSVADYYLGLREQLEFQQLRRALPRAGIALEHAEKFHSVRVGTAELAARACQYRLASLVGRGDRLPLPATLPHCGKYQTRLEQVFAGRRSAEAEELHQLISLRFTELEAACAAVIRSQDTLRSFATSPAGVDEATVVRALELLALERRAFVQISRDYNRRIARYAELAAPGQLGPDQLIGMLIMRDPAATAIRPTLSSPPGDRRSQASGSSQPTLAGGINEWTPVDSNDSATALRDGAITPASAQESGESPERSLIVPRR